MKFVHLFRENAPSNLAMGVADDQLAHVVEFRELLRHHNRARVWKLCNQPILQCNDAVHCIVQHTKAVRSRVCDTEQRSLSCYAAIVSERG